MKKVKVIIRDKNTIVLKEDAAVDDIIDLTEVMEIDTSAIMRSFEDAKEDIYNKRLSEQEKVLETEYSKRLLEQENSIRRTYLAEIETLKEKNNTLKIELESNVQLEKTKLQAEYDRRIFEQEKALKSIDGVENVAVKLDDKKASITSTKSINNDEIKKVIEDIGFEVKDII